MSMRVWVIACLAVAVCLLQFGYVDMPGKGGLACTTDLDNNRFIIGTTCDLNRSGMRLYYPQAPLNASPSARYVHTIHDGDYTEYGSSVKPAAGVLYSTAHGRDGVCLVMTLDKGSHTYWPTKELLLNIFQAGVAYSRICYLSRYRVIGGDYVPDVSAVDAFFWARLPLDAAVVLLVIQRLLNRWRHRKRQRSPVIPSSEYEPSPGKVNAWNAFCRFNVALLLCLWYVWGTLFITVYQPSTLVYGTLIGLPGAVCVAWLACAWQRLMGRFGARSSYRLLALFNVWILLLHRHIVLPLAPSWWVYLSGGLTLALALLLDRRLTPGNTGLDTQPCTTTRIS